MFTYSHSDTSTARLSARSLPPPAAAPAGPAEAPGRLSARRPTGAPGARAGAVQPSPALLASCLGSQCGRCLAPAGPHRGARGARRRCTAWACTRCPGSRRASCRASCRGSSSWAAWCSGAPAARPGASLGGRAGAWGSQMRVWAGCAICAGAEHERGLRAEGTCDDCVRQGAGLPLLRSTRHELRRWLRLHDLLSVYGTSARQGLHLWPAEAAPAQTNLPDRHKAVPARQTCASCRAGTAPMGASRAQARAALADAPGPGHAARRLRAPGRNRAAGHALGGCHHLALVRPRAARPPRARATGAVHPPRPGP